MKHKKRRGNSRYYIFFALSLMAILALGLGLFHFMLHLSWLEVQHINIAGNLVVPDSLVYQTCSKHLGTNLFKVPTRELAAELNQFSRIKSVKVRRRIPATINLTITERKAFLYVKSFEGRLYPIDSEAIVMKSYSPIANEDIPIFSSYYTDEQLKPGTRLKKADLNKIIAVHKRVVHEASDYLPIISEYYLIDNTVYMVDARYGTRIIPSEENMAIQLKRYQFVQDNGNISRNKVVDLRFENQVVVKGAER
ncbi:MAG: FtsQ-type POTRA domain-containing protein [Candidatus Cloacimonetes bacterium]|jgi:cell division septal protein FtsQ|nr:FtsQ-type POTRA domain-containing protein [Candidatus Cloacimonadota bacterium]